MKLTRRSLLKSAAATAVVAGQPGGALGAVSGAAETAAAQPLYAVISPGKAWAVYKSYHDAYRRTGEIRMASALQSSYVRCTPAFAEQVRSGALKSFVEIDGWAVTHREAESRGLDFLRDAVDRMKARTQLIAHYRTLAADKVNRRDRLQSAQWSYVETDEGRDRRIVAVSDDRSAIPEMADTSSEVERHLQVQRCSQTLRIALQDWLDGHCDKPEIARQFDVHSTMDEYDQRLIEDPMFRFAVRGHLSRQPRQDDTGGFVAYDAASRWVFGAGDSEDSAQEAANWAKGYCDGGQLNIVRASRRLCAVVRSQGLEIPPFWTIKGRTARHESELQKPKATQQTRRAIRPPKPDWK